MNVNAIFHSTQTEPIGRTITESGLHAAAGHVGEQLDPRAVRRDQKHIEILVPRATSMDTSTAVPGGAGFAMRGIEYRGRGPLEEHGGLRECSSVMVKMVGFGEKRCGYWRWGVTNHSFPLCGGCVFGGGFQTGGGEFKSSRVEEWAGMFGVA